MSEQQWTPVAEHGDLKEGVPLSVKVGKQDVLLVRIGDEIHACGGKCTHYGAPLAQGVLRGHVVTCPWHSARFDVRTGEPVSPPALDSTGCYPVKVEDGQVYVGKAAEPEPPKIGGDDDRTFVIAGAGGAGNAAAQTLRAEGFAGRIVLITAEEEPPYDRPTLSKEFMAGEAPRDWLPLHSADFYETWEIELLTGRRVESLRPEERVLAFADGEELSFDRALLATGGRPRRLSVPGIDLEGCFLLRSMADGEAIVAALEGAERAVIIGAGFIGMEVASSLRERGLEVHVVAREEVPLVRAFGEGIGRWLQGLHREEGVLFHMDETAEEISGNGTVESVVLSGGERIEADVVIVGVGVLPVVDYLKGTKLVEDGVVPVDSTLKTRAADVWAAGDIAVVPEPNSNRSHRIEHWVVAESQGQHAARAMLGNDEPYREVPFFWTRQCGISLKYVGYPCRPQRTVLRGSLEEGEFLAGYYVDGQMRAVAGAGRPSEIIAAAELLKAGHKVAPAEFADPQIDLLGLLDQA